MENRATGLIPSFPSPLDEKNGIPVSPRKAGPALDLDLEKEPESELGLEEPQKPGKPSVTVVFRKVRCLPEGSARRQLPTIYPGAFSAALGLRAYSPVSLGQGDWDAVGGLQQEAWMPRVGCSSRLGCHGWAAAAGLGAAWWTRGCPAHSRPCLRLPDLADGAVPCVGLHSHPVGLPCSHSHGDQLYQPRKVE